MNQQQLSPHMVAAQKGIADGKQSNIIRKITIESITPIIQKLQQHITFLLGEMNFLRKQNNNLKTATATQATIKQNYIKICSDYQFLRNQIRLVSKQKDVKLQQKQNEINLIRQDIKKLHQQSLKQKQKTSQIIHNNEDYLYRIQKNKTQQLQSMDSVKVKLNNYYQQQLIKIERIQNQIQYYRHQLQSFHKIKQKEKEELISLNKIIALYQSDRDILKKAVDKTTFLENNVVMLEEYQKDKKYQMIQNQQLKKQIKDMIDQALTPDIRQFLPQLIAKLAQLNSFDAILKKVVNSSEEAQKENNRKFNELNTLWKQKLTEERQRNDRDIKRLTSKMITNSESLLDKIMTIQQVFTLKHNDFKQQIEMMEIGLNKKIDESIERSIVDADKDMKQYINTWGQNFLDKKKDDIFQLVQQSKPQQKKHQQQKMIAVVNNIEPILKQVQLQLKKSQQSTSILYQKLSLFNNQIIKFKSDTNQKTTQYYNKLQLLNVKLNQNKQTSQELSLMTSKLLETQIILYALNLNKKFSNKDDQVYVTYNDGLILEVKDKAALYYRRKEVIPQLFKRTVLTQLVKLIDHNIIKKPLLGWHNQQLKPSHMFHQIAATYTASLQNHEEITNTRNQVESRQSISSKDQRRQNRKFLNIKQGSNMPKIAQKQKNGKSRQEGIKSFNSTIRYQDHEERQQYSSKRKSVVLKKIQK